MAKETKTDKKLDVQELNEQHKQALNSLFSEFKGQVCDICEHADQVHRVEFTAKIKNGTAFAFSYNSDQWLRKMMPEAKREAGRYSPAAPFNAIVDIIGALIGVALMIICAITMNRLPVFGLPGVLTVFTFTVFIAYFVVASIYHLFPIHSQVRVVFFNLIAALKIVSLLFVNFILAVLLPGSPNSPILIFTSIFIAAMALLMLSFRTKGGYNASLVFSSAIPFLAFINNVNIPHDYLPVVLPFMIPEMIMLCLWSLLPLILPTRISGKEAEGKSNNIFPIMGMGCFFFLLQTMLSLGL